MKLAVKYQLLTCFRKPSYVYILCYTLQKLTSCACDLMVSHTIGIITLFIPAFIIVFSRQFLVAFNNVQISSIKVAFSLWPHTSLPWVAHLLSVAFLLKGSAIPAVPICHVPGLLPNTCPEFAPTTIWMLLGPLYCVSCLHRTRVFVLNLLSPLSGTSSQKVPDYTTSRWLTKKKNVFSVTNIPGPRSESSDLFLSLPSWKLSDSKNTLKSMRLWLNSKSFSLCWSILVSC